MNLLSDLYLFQRLVLLPVWLLFPAWLHGSWVLGKSWRHPSAPLPSIKWCRWQLCWHCRLPAIVQQWHVLVIRHRSIPGLTLSTFMCTGWVPDEGGVEGGWLLWWICPGMCCLAFPYAPCSSSPNTGYIWIMMIRWRILQSWLVVSFNSLYISDSPHLFCLYILIEY